MRNFLRFRYMLAPLLIEIFFWFGVLLCVVTAIKDVFFDDKILLGISLFIFGPLMLRIFSEIFIVIFRIQQSLEDISQGINQTKDSE